jgi:hypothetical protein
MGIVTLSEEFGNEGGFSITGKDSIALWRLLTLRQGIKLEGKGMKMSRGRSCLAIVKSEFGWKGNRAKILALLEAEIDRVPGWEQA